MKKSKEEKHARKKQVKRLMDLTRDITKYSFKTSSTITVSDSVESKNKPMAIDSIETLENILAIEPPKESLWCKKIDIDDSDHLNDGSNTAVILSNDRIIVDTISKYIRRINYFQATEPPAIISQDLLTAYNCFVNETYDLLQKKKFPKVETIKINPYHILAYILMPIMETTEIESKTIFEGVYGSAKEIRASTDIPLLYEHKLFVCLDDCMLQIIRNSSKRPKSLDCYSYEYYNDTVDDFFKEVYGKPIFAAKLYIPIYKIERHYRIKIGFIEATFDKHIINMLSENPRLFVEKYVNGCDNCNGFYITKVTLDVTSYYASMTNHSGSNNKNSYIPFRSIIVTPEPTSDTDMMLLTKIISESNGRLPKLIEGGTSV